MRRLFAARCNWSMLVLLGSVALASVGCSRSHYRIQADQDAYQLIAERNCDTRWHAADVNIDIDKRSRYFDPYNPDRPPMPPDDPTSHIYMHCVDGKKGWKHWHRNGDRLTLENPVWRRVLGEYVELGEENAVKLDLETALKLAYVHSPNHQRQLETLYLSALDVSAERFRLDTQFFGGYDTRWGHTGSLIPASISFSPILRRFVVNPPFQSPSAETNRLTLGRPTSALPVVQARKRFATAGEILVGIANSFVFEFTGPDVNLAASLANFSIVQPLLRGAGKDVALEQLTFEERKLLANLRAYAQFRQGFYTFISFGELGVTGPQRAGPTTSLQSFGGQGNVGGYLGLLQQRQQIRNGEDNLRLQLRTLDLLEAFLVEGYINIVQVDRFRQDIETQRAALLSQQNSLELAYDRYKTSQLGLPPHLPIELDESLIAQFELISRDSIELQSSIVAMQKRISALPKYPDYSEIEKGIDEAKEFLDPVDELIESAKADLDKMKEIAEQRVKRMSAEEKDLFEAERERIRTEYDALLEAFAKKKEELKALKDALQEDVRKNLETAFSTAQTVAEQTLLPAGLPTGLMIQATAAAKFVEFRDNALKQSLSRGLVTWIREYLQLVGRFALIPAQARLEAITVPAVDLEAGDAFRIALANRLDFMNGRAALVDQWRLVQVRADALQAVLNVTADGEVRTARNNAASFRAPTGSVRLGLEFDAPFTRLLERNAYREALIEYQRNRRSFIQSRDGLELGVRALVRNLEQLRQNLEIQRRAVRIAMRRVDQTQLELNPARDLIQPGQRPPIDPTTAINLLAAQSSLRDTQNAFLSAWLNYYATRLRLYRELGVMVIDPEGRWIEHPLTPDKEESSDDPKSDKPEELPPPAPAEAKPGN